jgi:UDP-N-acetyl-D-glucosamine dehydrogenase
MPSKVQPVRVVVVGQGYVGLPLAMRSVDVGHDVVGVETDRHRLGMLSNGNSYVDDVSRQSLQGALDSDRYVVTSEYCLAKGFDVALITVPTPLSQGRPDLQFVDSAATALAPYVEPGSLVVLESTTYPGTTRDRLVPLLEAGSGLVAGVDFSVGYSPERIDPGNPTWGLWNTPKVVSGITATCLARAVDFYSSIVETVVSVVGCEEAELTKLLENTFRNVNIALVNELAIFAKELGIDLWAAIDAASTKPFGFMRFTPGPGVGGHCLPIDPSYLSWRVNQSLGKPFRFVELAADVNRRMPSYVVQRIVENLNRVKKSVNGSRIVVLGLSYKPNSGDRRESPAVEIVEGLTRLGAIVKAVDPLVPQTQWLGDAEITDIDNAGIEDADLVVLTTDHDAFDFEAIASKSSRIFDTRSRFEKGPRIEFL